MERIKNPSSAVEECSRFNICQHNKCPLHIDYKKLEVFEEDKELWNYEKCKLSKKRRIEIGEKWKLKNRGLTNKEIASKNLSEKMKL